MVRFPWGRSAEPGFGLDRLARDGEFRLQVAGLIDLGGALRGGAPAGGIILLRLQYRAGCLGPQQTQAKVPLLRAPHARAGIEGGVISGPPDVGVHLRVAVVYQRGVGSFGKRWSRNR